MRDPEARQRDRQLTRALHAAGSIFLQAAQDDGFQLLRDVGTNAAKRCGRVADDRRERGSGALGLERGAPCEQPVEDRPERPHVGAPVHVTRIPDLLRGHVERRAQHVARRGELLVVRAQHLRDAEVEHLHERRAVRLADEEQVRRLEIAMNDPEAVRLCDGLACLEHVRSRLSVTGSGPRSFE
ncbi:MAG: hypothetical protein R3F14_09580 [Polyangiaceae bacterium]